MIEEGMILRVTRATEGASDPANLLGGRLGWALCLQDADDEMDSALQWLIPTVHELPALDRCPYLSEAAGDEWTVPAEDKVPGKVWAALAKWRLTE
jgi:hypothetical protein